MGNNIFLIVGMSGSGKTTIVEALEKEYSLTSIQSYTTRPKRNENETGHIFVSDDEFSKLKDIAAYTEFDGYKYCATSKQIDNTDLYIIDPKGIDYFKEHYKGHKDIKIIYIDSPFTALYERMVFRAEKNNIPYLTAVDNALQRFKNDISEFYDYIHHIKKTDYTVSNNKDTNIDSLVNDIYNFICNCNRE